VIFLALLLILAIGFIVMQMAKPIDSGAEAGSRGPVYAMNGATWPGAANGLAGR